MRTGRPDELLYPAGSARPWIHLALTFGPGAVAFSVAIAIAITNPGWLELAFGLGLVALGSTIEWWVHRAILHAPQRPLTLLYQRHAVVHHGRFTARRMAIEQPGELSIVLLKPWTVLFIGACGLPPAIVFEQLGLRGFAALSVAVPTGYALLYEATHLVCHLPAHRVFRVGPLAWLRAHHARHHDPRNMRTHNFNVALPLWDRVRGTLLTRDAADRD
ncbi:MAG: sterol desaturase family protein [Sandaracinaceae bacterium]